MSLAGVDGAFGLLVVVVENLEFAHADVGGIAGAGVTDREAVVAGGRELELHARLKIRELAIPVDRAAFALLPDERAVFGRNGFKRAGPAVEILSVKYRLKTLGPAGGEQAGGLGGADFADEKIAPPGFAAVGLELDGAARGNGALLGGRETLVVEVLEDHVVNDRLIVEPDAHAAADHHNAETIPLAHGLVGAHERVAAGGSFGVVPEAAGAFGGAVALGVGHGGVPDLNLRDAA